MEDEKNSVNAAIQAFAIKTAMVSVDPLALDLLYSDEYSACRMWQLLMAMADGIGWAEIIEIADAVTDEQAVELRRKAVAAAYGPEKTEDAEPCASLAQSGLFQRGMIMFRENAEKKKNSRIRRKKQSRQKVLFARILSRNLDEKQLEQVRHAVLEGIPYTEIDRFARKDVPASRMEALIDIRKAQSQMMENLP